MLLLHEYSKDSQTDSATDQSGTQIFVAYKLAHEYTVDYPGVQIIKI